MKRVLIVGGTGLTGAHAALYLKRQGMEVTIMSRRPPAMDCLKELPHLAANYVDNDVSAETFSRFDSMVFAGGADIRQFPPGEDEADFYQRVNVQGIPDFFRSARDGGVESAVYIGSYYPQVVPEAIERSVYVRSRHLACAGVRDLNSDSFRVCSLNAPFILGYVPGIDLPHLAGLVQYAQGKLEGMPLVAPAGGVNHISSQSMSEAIAGALARGKGGHAYLVGDENLSWKEYLQLYLEAVGNPQDLPVSEEEHPLFPDVMLYAGRNAVVNYEPENGELSYSRNKVREAVEQVVEAYS